MKQKLFSLLLAIAASVGTMFASTKIGDLYYNLNATKQTAEVTYQLRWDANNYSGLITAIIPTSVTYNSTTYSVTSIGDNAFAKCTGLTSVTIPNSVTSIGMQAFCDCSGLTSITIGSGVTSCGQNAFNGCTSLTAVHISDLAAWCNISCYYGGSSPLECAHNLYLNGELVTDLIIPNGFTSIGGAAFRGCSGLTSVTIPNSVTSIAYCTFENCTGLTSITIPNSVTSIGSNAFEGCTALTKLLSLATKPPKCGTNALNDINKQNCTLTIPEGTLSKYQAADQWKDFLFIEEKDLSSINTITTDDGTKLEIKETYDLNGHKITGLKRGLNIVKMSDGTAKKIVVK